MKKMSNTNKLSRVNEPVQTLRKIQTIAPNAIIAGGYFRDRFNEVPFNDIDIYLKQPVNPTSMGVHEVHDANFWAEFFDLKEDSWHSMDTISNISNTDEEYNVSHNRNLITVFEMIKNELRYNILIIDIDPVTYVNKMFDFNICKAYCDGKKITYTKEFMSDITHKNITFSNKKTSTTNFAHAVQIHLPKLQTKYPDHALVIPEIHQKMYLTYKKKYT